MSRRDPEVSRRESRRESGVPARPRSVPARVPARVRSPGATPKCPGASRESRRDPKVSRRESGVPARPRSVPARVPARVRSPGATPKCPGASRESRRDPEVSRRDPKVSRRESGVPARPRSVPARPQSVPARPQSVPARVGSPGASRESRSELILAKCWTSRWWKCGGAAPRSGAPGWIIDQVWEGRKEGAGVGTPESGSRKEVTNRWDGEAESQWIVAARLLYHLQYLVPYLSRLQRIHLPDRLKL